MNWLYKHGFISERTPPVSAHGFVYEITLTDGTKYLGKKAFWSTVKKKLTLKEMEARPSKRHKNWKHVTTESKWRTYNGSSKLFGTKDIAEKRILVIAKSKKHLTYLETKFMFERNVIESELYRNDNIAGKFFRGEFDEMS